MRKCCLALCLAFIVAGCTTAPPALVTANNDDGTWPRLTPKSLGETLTANQVLRVAVGAREATLNCIVSVTPQQITIVGMTALGIRAFTVKFDGEQVSAEAQVAVPQALPPERLVNDLQLVYWPLATLKAELARSEWQVSEPAPFTRRLRRRDRVIAEVHYGSADAWAGRAWLVNLEFGYTRNIESQRLAARPAARPAAPPAAATP